MIFGIILLAGMFFVGNVFITPQQKEQIKWARGACNFPLFGSLSKALSADVANTCRNIETAYKIMQFSPYVYGFGALLFVLGLILPSEKKEVKVIREVPTPITRAEKLEKPEEKVTKVSEKTYKFCGNCGAKVSKNIKFCSKCGEKL